MNFGVQVTEMGRPADAVPITEEAVAIYRELADINPGKYRPGLARALSNLSIQVQARGGAAGASPAIAETVEIGRELVAANRGQGRKRLAGSLTNFGIVYSALGKLEETLKTNLGTRLSKPGRYADALAVTDEAVPWGRPPTRCRL
jgi:hypothetical protein